MRLSPRIPHISILRAFEASVRHGSVARAAAELNITAGAVSRAIKELEIELGFTLFRRGNRVVTPTAAAEVLARSVRESLRGLSAALTAARGASADGQPLVLSCEPTFLMRWLIPRLADLQATVGAQRELRLVAAGGAVPFAREGIDLAVRRADFTLPGDALVEPFLDERIGPVCRPDLAQSCNTGSIRGVLLHTATRLDAWTKWSQTSETQVTPVREIRFEHFYLSLQAAIAGAGLAIGPVALVADDLVAGSLVAPRGFVKDGTAYVLMAPRTLVDPGVFRMVLGWLKARTATLPPASGVS